MSYRFFHAQPPIEGVITLVGDQAHHAVNVMRYQQGDRIVLFDGQGSEHDGEILHLTKKKLTVRVIETRKTERSHSREITIAVALPKGDRQKFMVEKLVELGVTTLIPLSSRRSVAEVKPKVIERIEKQIIEASKQCGRNYLMRVASPTTVDQLAHGNEFPKEPSSPHAGNGVRLLAHPYTDTRIADFSLKSSKRIVIAIGPEGGFDDSEVEALVESGWQPTRIGPTILRIETAAITAAAVLGVTGQ